MRRALVLALLVAAPACRRSLPAAPSIAPVPVADTAAAVAPAPPQTEAPQPSPPPPATAPPPAAAAPAPAEPAPAAAEVAPHADGEPEDTSIYTWTDEGGTIHFGRSDEAPPGERRKVGGRVTVVPSPAYDAPIVSSSPAPSAEPAPADAPGVKGDRPQLDSQGLPIPGTMSDTAHTRAVQQATGMQLDPASVERRRAIENRRMNCVERDGVTICAGE